MGSRKVIKSCGVFLIIMVLLSTAVIARELIENSEPPSTTVIARELIENSEPPSTTVIARELIENSEPPSTTGENVYVGSTVCNKCLSRAPPRDGNYKVIACCP
ncbi:unnamed protein product [Ilex paraguariensis]|uniref:Uncharacterized protein n=1 Tax=Ilex paraguariensis TaxID=185542 RepID=A0ABC8REL3_9AQUA